MGSDDEFGWNSAHMPRHRVAISKPFLMGQTVSREWGIAVLKCNAWVKNCTASNAVVIEPNVEAAFKNFDGDGNGAIDVVELRSALEALGLPCGESQTAAILAKFDDDGNLTLELARCMTHRSLERVLKHACHICTFIDRLPPFDSLRNSGRVPTSGQRLQVICRNERRRGRRCDEG